jgi:hypothetical protein
MDSPATGRAKPACRNGTACADGYHKEALIFMQTHPLVHANLHAGDLPSTRRTAVDTNLAGVHYPGSVLAHFLELRGRRVTKACGALWYDLPGRFMMSLPYQNLLNPHPKELADMIRQSGVLGVRFPSEHWTGLESGLYVIRRQPYEIGSVHVKHRPRVRRGLDHFRVRPATKLEMLRQSRELNLSTMRRQGRYDDEFGDARRWQTFVEAAFTCTEISCPAAFVGPRMAAYMITCREHGWLHILHQMSNQEDLGDFPNHVLTFTVTKQAMEDESLDAVCYGYVPLFEADGLHEYKLRFGYELLPHQSAIQLHPAMGGILNNGLTRAAIRSARWLGLRNQRMETIQTVLEGASRSRPVAQTC